MREEGRPVADGGRLRLELAMEVVEVSSSFLVWLMLASALMREESRDREEVRENGGGFVEAMEAGVCVPRGEEAREGVDESFERSRAIVCWVDASENTKSSCASPFPSFPLFA